MDWGQAGLAIILPWFPAPSVLNFNALLLTSKKDYYIFIDTEITQRKTPPSEKVVCLLPLGEKKKRKPHRFGTAQGVFHALNINHTFVLLCLFLAVCLHSATCCTLREKRDVRVVAVNSEIEKGAENKQMVVSHVLGSFSGLVYFWKIQQY